MLTRLDLSELPAPAALSGPVEVLPGMPYPSYRLLIIGVGPFPKMGIEGSAAATLVAQATQAQQSRSGVNLDEEAANLLRYQQAYQASGRMIQMANALFQTLLDLGR